MSSAPSHKRPLSPSLEQRPVAGREGDQKPIAGREGDLQPSEGDHKAESDSDVDSFVDGLLRSDDDPELIAEDAMRKRRKMDDGTSARSSRMPTLVLQ